MITTAIYQVILVAVAWQAFQWLAIRMPTYSSTNAVIAFVLIAFVYFGLSAMFAYIDVTQKPSWIYRRKYQKDACINYQRYRQAFSHTFAKLVAFLLPFLIITFKLMQWRTRRFANVDASLNRGGFLVFIGVLFVVYVIAEFAAWFIHYALHKGVLWDKIHSVHHQYVATVAVASLDAHPVEMIVWDAVPFMAGPLLLGTPPAFFIIFALINIVNTVLCHCGYDVGYDRGHHDLHHERLKCNYSGFLSDWVMGTYVTREENKTYPRFDAFQKDLINTANESCDEIDGKARLLTI